MTIAKTILRIQEYSSIEEYAQAFESAKKLAVDTEEDYAEETTTFTFEDNSKLRFCNCDFYELLCLSKPTNE